MTEPPWYVTAFEQRYREVYAHRDVQSAREEVAALLRLGVRGRTLDLCCGFGRHTLALLEQGLDAYGLDLSADLLMAARALPEAAALRGRLLRGDARALPFRPAVFQSVCVLFNSFGYFTDAQNQRMLAEVARVLTPGGAAVLDLMNAKRVRAELVGESERALAGRRLRERRRLIDGGRRVLKELELQGGDGVPERWREEVRMYELAELGALAREAGLELSKACGSFRGEVFEPSSERMLVWLQRPSDLT